jgi:quercetin dioxygenase-like cupin family protein
MDHLFVKGTDAARGARGEKLLIEGDAARLRVWEGEPAGETAPEHANAYEYLAYVVAGRMLVRVGDEDPFVAEAGDSYRVPSGTPYAFEVLEQATVVEALSGGPAVGPTGGPTLADETFPA